jgi:hypothetical protein
MTHVSRSEIGSFLDDRCNLHVRQRPVSQGRIFFDQPLFFSQSCCDRPTRYSSQAYANLFLLASNASSDVLWMVPSA